jgi:hypothetical protein
LDARRVNQVPWRHENGAVVAWQMENRRYVATRNLGTSLTTSRIEGAGDFDADDDDDVLWRHADGGVAHWEMEAWASPDPRVHTVLPLDWQIARVEDFDLT